MLAIVFALSLLDFGKGPAQWLMTADDQRAWRAVKTEDEARDFADLFWARRDPTPGTPRNEFREEFESRVTYADNHFKEGGKRGALTERGRVLVALGFPTNLGTEAEKKTAQYVMSQTRDNPDPTGGRAMAAREVWVWSHTDALKYGVPKIEVVFFHDGVKGQARRDPQRADFMQALPGALKSAIKSPELKTVPDWARSGVRWEEGKVVAPAVAAPLLDFGKGPAQWLMTADDQRAWRAVKNEDQAREFSELFWARRDPTPDTPRNEFREEFEERVDYADKNFEEAGKRGALTERGRVIILLGMPTHVAGSVWTWEQKEAARIGVRPFKVVFIYVDGRIVARSQADAPDLVLAYPAAIKAALKNPDLKSVPAAMKAQPAPPASADPVTQLAEGAAIPQPEPPAVPKLKLPTAKAARPAGVAKLTLVKDAFALQPQSGTEPLDGVSSRTKFAKESELGWALEYCTGDAATELPSLTVSLKMSGPKEGDLSNFTAPAEEMVPDSIRSAPGCFLVRGSVPLLEMESGTYDLAVTVGKYNLKREFKIE